MKKFTALLLALVMVFALAACGSKNEAPAGSAAAEGSAAEEVVTDGTGYAHIRRLL